MAAPRLLWLDYCCAPQRNGLFHVAQSCGDAQRISGPADVLPAAHAFEPNAVCVEYDYPDGARLRAIPLVRRAFPALPVLVLTEYHSEALAVWAYRHRVWDYRVKPIPDEALSRVLDALTSFASGRQPRGWLSDGLPPELIAPSGHLHKPLMAAPRTAPAIACVSEHYGEIVRLKTVARLCRLSESEFPHLSSRTRHVVPAISAELPDRDGTRFPSRAAGMHLRGRLCRRLQRPFAFRADLPSFRRRTTHPLQPARQPLVRRRRESRQPRRNIPPKRKSILTAGPGTAGSSSFVTLPWRKPKPLAIGGRAVCASVAQTEHPPNPGDGSGSTTRAGGLATEFATATNTKSSPLATQCPAHRSRKPGRQTRGVGVMSRIRPFLTWVTLAVLLLAPALVNATPVLSFNQVDFFQNGGLVIPNSEWGEFDIAYDQGSSLQWINIVANPGTPNARWIVQNHPYCRRA